MQESAQARQAAAQLIIISSSAMALQHSAHFRQTSLQSLHMLAMNSEPHIIMFMQVWQISAQSRIMPIIIGSM
ncbi:hypothetical protein [Synechococcus elongatus]|uniref:Uncharacterized protein n=1 Tax=Synechococcus elongatus PCC 11802 TaxID=2283154 RepID=A0AAT9JTQ7_SYNEL|nr:hypothetical protein [Synechococcus elongatus]